MRCQYRPIFHLERLSRSSASASVFEQAATLPEDDRAWLAARLARLEQEWATAITSMPTCVVHGDAWTGNIVAARDGHVILLDLERCSVGPPEWDLVSTAVKYVTFGQVSPAEYQQFCDAYGQDVTNWNGFPVLRDIRELRMTCYVAQQAAEHSKFADEASLRVACLQGQRGPPALALDARLGVMVIRVLITACLTVGGSGAPPGLTRRPKVSQGRLVKALKAAWSALMARRAGRSWRNAMPVRLEPAPGITDRLLRSVLSVDPAQSAADLAALARARYEDPNMVGVRTRGSAKSAGFWRGPRAVSVLMVVSARNRCA